jgi:hypothetical protein
MCKFENNNDVQYSIALKVCLKHAFFYDTISRSC